ncbi:hypothetical protein WJX72_006098 [[Myrmecia] bisecta]|uniref:Protein CMSS1 n=1 Tax=[Myrmecia] bisecta TaxID=41462 RepID=A0AAW1PQ08_9CHLO
MLSTAAADCQAAKALKEQKLTGKPPTSGSQDGDEGNLSDSAQLPTQQTAQLTKKQRAKLEQAALEPAVPKPSAVDHKAAQELAARIAQADPAQQASWLWDSFARCTGASYLEKEGFQETSIARLPQDGSLEHRLKSTEANWRCEYCGAGEDGKRQPGMPSLLLIGPSAVGTNNLIKKLPAFAKANKIGKLFAKHFKVPEQQQFLARQPCCVAVGTPHRLCKLADLEALKLDRLKLIVVDVHLDAKQRTILDIPETRGDFWEFIKKHCQSRLAAGKTRIALINSEQIEAAPAPES